ncbi:hypothetical protein F5Y18DRAFT_437831 [Xylariaceae sp. FL1019]|nr:hypothetical protein F5Y18DRAFT_437831 [Xylariaceae sp. FL1019]
MSQPDRLSFQGNQRWPTIEYRCPDYDKEPIKRTMSYIQISTLELAKDACWYFNMEQEARCAQEDKDFIAKEVFKLLDERVARLRHAFTIPKDIYEALDEFKTNQVFMSRFPGREDLIDDYLERERLLETQRQVFKQDIFARHQFNDEKNLEWFHYAWFDIVRYLRVFAHQDPHHFKQLRSDLEPVLEMSRQRGSVAPVRQ